jgi:hypothetical protein
MKKSSNGSLSLFEKFKTNNLKSIVGGEYSYEETVKDQRPDEHLITTDSGKRYLDGHYWCDTGTWEWGGSIVTSVTSGAILPPEPI